MPGRTRELEGFRWRCMADPEGNEFDIDVLPQVVSVQAPENLYSLLSRYRGDLRYLWIVSGVEVKNSRGRLYVVIPVSMRHPIILRHEGAEAPAGVGEPCAGASAWQSN